MAPSRLSPIAATAVAIRWRPGLGMAAGAPAATSIVVMAVRWPSLGPLRPAPLRDLRPRLLVVVSSVLEDDRAIEKVAGAAIGGIDETDAEVLVLAPARHRFLVPKSLPGLAVGTTFGYQRTLRFQPPQTPSLLAELTEAMTGRIGPEVQSVSVFTRRQRSRGIVDCRR